MTYGTTNPNLLYLFIINIYKHLLSDKYSARDIIADYE